MEGKVFSSWTVLKYFHDKKPGKHYECRCKCGNLAIIPGTTLRAGRSTKCKECMYLELYNPNKIIGKRFGNWTVVSFHGNRKNKNGSKGYLTYDCVCDCKNELVINGSDLKTGRTKKCNDCSRKKNLENALEVNTTHGMHKTNIYKIWSTMKCRCLNEKSKFYNRYGGRGIKVCDRWMEFKNFYEDMGDKPKDLELDRIDNNGNYEPLNCRWVTHKENCNNRYY